MKKIITLFVVFAWLFISANTFAQTKEEKKIAKQLCDCTQKMLKEYHPLFTQMLLDMAEFGEEKAQEKFMSKFLALPDAEKEAFSKSLTEKPVDATLEKYCGDAKNFIQKSKMDNSGEEGLKKIMAVMKKDKKCKQGYAIMLLGLKSKK